MRPYSITQCQSKDQAGIVAAKLQVVESNTLAFDTLSRGLIATAKILCLSRTAPIGRIGIDRISLVLHKEQEIASRRRFRHRKFDRFSETKVWNRSRDHPETDQQHFVPRPPESFMELTRNTLRNIDIVPGATVVSAGWRL